MSHAGAQLLAERWKIIQASIRGVNVHPEKGTLAKTRLRLMVDALPYSRFKIEWLCGFSVLLVVQQRMSQGIVLHLIPGEIILKWPLCLFQPLIELPPESASLSARAFRSEKRAYQKERLAPCRFFPDGRSNVSALILRNPEGERITVRNRGFKAPP